MSYITNSIDKVINIANQAVESCEKIDDINIKCLIGNLYCELINIRIALKMRKKLEKKLPTFDILKYSKLLDLLYELEKSTA